MAEWITIALIVAAAIYFLPGIVAISRGHRQTGAIAVLNLLLGWTLLGWVISLVWACTNGPKERIVYMTSPLDPTDSACSLGQNSVTRDQRSTGKTQALDDGVEYWDAGDRRW